MKRLFEYCDWVEANPDKTCIWTKLAVKRFRKDWERMETDPSFPFTFSKQKAELAIQFTEILKQYKDQFAGQKLHLEPWQVFIFANIYGWVYKETGLRRFRKAFVFVARKNGKSTMMSSVLLLDALLTNGAECFCAATKQAQAKIIYESVEQMVRQNPDLMEIFRIYNSTSTMVNTTNNAKITALSSNNKKFDGLNPSCVVCDEVAAMKDYGTIKVLQSGMGARPEPLLFEITSGSDDMNSAGHQEYERSQKILEGSMEDESFFCILYSIDKEDSWMDEECWIKANPNLGVSVKLDTMRKLCTEAKQNPMLEGEFRIKNLCQFISPITAWIPYQKWLNCKLNADKYEFPNPKDCAIVGAIDLSKRADFTSYVLYFYNPKSDMFFAKHRFYIPQEQVEEKCKADSPMIWKWVEEGYITATPGNIVNYNIMFDDIKADLEQYDIKEICFDPWNAATLINEIGPLVDLVELKQSAANISPMAKDWEAAVIGGKIVDPNPVMAWMVSNCDIYKDVNENIRPQKHGGKDSVLHIDGVVTSLIALGRIRQLLAEGYIDFRTPEQIQADMERRIASLNF